VYAPPPGAAPAPKGHTYYQVFDGPGALFNSDTSQPLCELDSLRGHLRPVRNLPGGDGPPLAELDPLRGVRMRGSPPEWEKITDGPENTVLICEAGQAVPWTKPEDIPFSPDGPLPPLGGMLPARDGYYVVLADGSVRRISRTLSAEVLRAAITPVGGEKLPRNW
jgi:hypothetical protein